MTTTPKGKKVRAWAVTKGGKILRDGYGKLMIGSMQGARWIYSYNCARKVHGMKIIPCTITYTLPTIKSRKPKKV